MRKLFQILITIDTSDKMVENMNPIKVYELLCRIGDEDMILLWMNSDYGRAESLIMWNIPVPPVPIRPSVYAIIIRSFTCI